MILGDKQTAADAEPQRYFEHSFVSIQLNDIARTVKHGGAALAALDDIRLRIPSINHVFSTDNRCEWDQR